MGLDKIEPENKPPRLRLEHVRFMKIDQIAQLNVFVK